MFLKLMSGDHVHDGDSRKRFRLLAKVASVEFRRVCAAPHGTYPEAQITFDDGNVETFGIEGNSYVLNDAGRTIASFAYADFDRSDAPGAPADPAPSPASLAA